MLKLKIESGAWVVVCDGAKALILENTGDEIFPNLKTREVRTHRESPAGEASDKREVQQSVANAPGIETDNLFPQSEQAFLEDLAGRLDAAVRTSEAKSVVVVAPPRALGMLREAYSPALRAAIRCEVDKDYVKMPVHEIEKHLAQLAPA